VPGRRTPRGWDTAGYTPVAYPGAPPGSASAVMHAAVVAGPPGSPQVVGVPGLGCSYRYFRPLARALAPTATTAVPDLPGFGRSPGPREALDVPALAAALGTWMRATGRAGSTLVANSLGCQVALELAARAPDVAGPLVLVGPAVDPRGAGVLRHVLRLGLDGLRERPTVVALVARDHLLGAGPRRVLATFRLALAHPVDEVAARVRVPVLVVRGERDPVAPRGWARDLAARLPDARVVEVAGHAHAVHHSDPGTVADLVRSVLPARGR
jgi:pimeloyl-ACP methyl ester carboxylesterase